MALSPAGVATVVLGECGVSWPSGPGRSLELGKMLRGLRVAPWSCGFRPALGEGRGGAAGGAALRTGVWLGAGAGHLHLEGRGRWLSPAGVTAGAWAEGPEAAQLCRTGSLGTAKEGWAPESPGHWRACTSVTAVSTTRGACPARSPRAERERALGGLRVGRAAGRPSPASFHSRSRYPCQELWALSPRPSPLVSDRGRASKWEGGSSPPCTPREAPLSQTASPSLARGWGLLGRAEPDSSLSTDPASLEEFKKRVLASQRSSAVPSR